MYIPCAFDIAARGPTAISRKLPSGRGEYGGRFSFFAIQYKKAIENSQVNEFIIDDDQMIEKNGNNLSGGQNQRIAIAREIIHGHKIILFDESTNALDKAKNLEMIKYLTSLNQTVIFIAHHVDNNIINCFDHIIDFENGIIQAK